ncbi:MAG: hypothetical protein ACLS6G_10715 [Christensenellales bacterium]
MADRIEIGWLFDFYGPLLTERQRKLLALYCNEDFSFRKSLPEKAFQTGFTTRFTARRVARGLRTAAWAAQADQSMTQGLEEGLSPKRADAARKGDSGAAAFTRGGVRWPLKD